MYKLVAIDVDGTLLNSSGELTKKTVDTLKLVKNKGVKVVLTSGRVTNSVKELSKKISADEFLICDNGASIYDINKKKTIWSREISLDTVIKLVDTCLKNNIYYMVFTDTDIIIKDLKHMALAFYKQRHNINDEATGIQEFKFGTLDYISQISKPVRRIVICDEDRAVYNSIVNYLKDFPDVSLMASPHVSNKIIKDEGKTLVLSYSYAEILPKSVNKWTAIEELIGNLGIRREEVIAIGDNFNDVDMVQNAGLGVAMNNGAKVLKDVSRVIAPSNDEDGVAVILEKYVLQ